MDTTSETSLPRPPLDDTERLRAFGEELDRIKAKVMTELGSDDVEYIRELDRFSHEMEVIGRTLIHLSPEPVTFTAGVLALWIHKQLQATEIGHTVLHGTYDRIPGAEAYNSKTFTWDAPIDEESWRYGHNVRHHGATNVVGHDPDIHFGPVRLTDDTPYAPKHRWQLLFTLVVLFPNFAFLMNPHFTGLSDAYFDNGLGKGRMDVLSERTPETVKAAWDKTLRKWLPYLQKEYVFYPLLAGPFFWKVALGNWLAGTLRDVYSAATIFCGHVGEDVKSYPEGSRARGRGEWYARQIEASNNFEVPWFLSVLCGGLDLQIEHHCFPTLSPERLRQVAPEVKAACQTYGVEYKTASWPATLKKAFAHIQRLSKAGGVREVMAAMA